tara:strand:- start:2357 stop:2863 length:507 start_codon:yes stop_codon:yes gene_type:complete
MTLLPRSQRQNWLHEGLEKYARWVPNNLQKIHDSARISETLNDYPTWSQMFGLDLFCIENQNDAKTYGTRSSKSLDAYYRESLSRECGRKPDRIVNGFFGETFPNIVNRPMRKKKQTKQYVQNTVYANAASADPISDALDTNFTQTDALAPFINAVKDAGATSITINL